MREYMGLILDVAKVLTGALLGFVLGWWSTILKERRERKQLHDALYQELSNCYEAISYLLEHKGEDFQFLKTKLKHELAFIAYDSAAKNAAALYSYPEHGYLICCYRELKKLADLTAETDDKDLINTLECTLGMIDNPTDTSVRKNLLKYLPTKYHKDVRALAL